MVTHSPENSWKVRPIIPVTSQWFHYNSSRCMDKWMDDTANTYTNMYIICVYIYTRVCVCVFTQLVIVMEIFPLNARGDIWCHCVHIKPCWMICSLSFSWSTAIHQQYAGAVWRYTLLFLSIHCWSWMTVVFFRLKPHLSDWKLLFFEE